MGDLSLKVLITAGVHPEEEAGVLYLRTKTIRSDWNNYLDISIVPCRNVYGFDIAKHIGSNSKHRDYYFGTFYQSKGRLFFVPSLSYIRNENNTDLRMLLTKTLSEESYKGFLDILSLRQGSQIHANSFFVQNGVLIDLNSRNNNLDSVFEFSTNNLLRTFNPHYFVDLHESLGEECFIYVSKNSPKAYSLAVRIIESLKAKCVPIRNTAKDRNLLYEGIFALESFVDYNSFCEENPIEMIFETGIDAAIDQRILWTDLFVSSFLALLPGIES